MEADKITFESEYMREYAKTAETAQRLVDEALASLKKANRHEGWRCPERQPINTSLSDISTRLGRANTCLKTTSSTLEKGAGQFADLETRAVKVESSVYNQLKKNWAFEANKWGGGNTNLTTCPVPDYENPQPSQSTLDDILLLILKGAFGLSKGAGDSLISNFEDRVSLLHWLLTKSLKLDQHWSNMQKFSESMPDNPSMKDLLNAVAESGILTTIYTALTFPVDPYELVAEAGFHGGIAIVDGITDGEVDASLRDLFSEKGLLPFYEHFFRDFFFPNTTYGIDSLVNG